MSVGHIFVSVNYKDKSMDVSSLLGLYLNYGEKYNQASVVCTNSM